MSLQNISNRCYIKLIQLSKESFYDNMLSIKYLAKSSFAIELFDLFFINVDRQQKNFFKILNIGMSYSNRMEILTSCCRHKILMTTI